MKSTNVEVFTELFSGKFKVTFGATESISQLNVKLGVVEL